MKDKLILIVDDSEGILESVSLILEAEGYRTLKARDCASTELLLTHTIPDLILLDYLLSGVNGIDFVKKLRSKKETASIPIILFSAHPKAEEEVKKISIDGYLAKPFDCEDLYRIVKKALRGSRRLT